MSYQKWDLLFNNFIIIIIQRKTHWGWSVESLTGAGAWATGKISAALHLAAWFIERMRETKCGAAPAKKPLVRLCVGPIILPLILWLLWLRRILLRCDFWSSYHCQLDKRTLDITGTKQNHCKFKFKIPVCDGNGNRWGYHKGGGRWGSH